MKRLAILLPFATATAAAATNYSLDLLPRETVQISVAEGATPFDPPVEPPVEPRVDPERPVAVNLPANQGGP